ncbi:hypothetical protein [Kribbella alba]|uniref:hypothetical protein n=1 Tax=Kribbella alba TaxID=190197 RepID=UPI0031D6D8E9
MGLEPVEVVEGPTGDAGGRQLDDAAEARLASASGAEEAGGELIQLDADPA